MTSYVPPFIVIPFFLQAHHALYSSLDKCGAKWSLREEFNSPGLFVGATVNLESEKDLAILADIPHVAKIFPIYLYRAPQPTESRDLVLDTGYAFDTFAPHVMTGVDKLHAQGYLGAGIRIALLDSGVDYRHPALGGNIGPGFKFTNQYDFSKDKPTTLVDVPDCRGHGTHGERRRCTAGFLSCLTLGYSSSSVWHYRRRSLFPQGHRCCPQSHFRDVVSRRHLICRED